MSSGFYLFLPTFKKLDLNLCLVSVKRDCGGAGVPAARGKEICLWLHGPCRWAGGGQRGRIPSVQCLSWSLGKHHVVGRDYKQVKLKAILRRERLNHV